MKVAVIGASGVVGQKIVREALAAGHVITAIARRADVLERALGDLVGVTIAVADVTSRDQLAEIVRGHDAIVCAVGPRSGGNQPDLARALVDVARLARVGRLLKVGWEEELFVSGGRIVNPPELPEEFWRGVAKLRRNISLALSVEDLDCTYVTPAAFLDTGVRTGGYRRGGGALIVDSTGQKRVSVDDFAIAVVDEVEKRHPSPSPIAANRRPSDLDRVFLAARRYGLIS
jgi:uncharacterized protein